jgi:hypothetical protein
MKRLIILIAAVVGSPSMAQTTLDITVPGTGQPVCSYITGPVTNETTPGHLQATATSSSGAGCGSQGVGNVTFGPASPLSPQTSNLAVSTGSVNFSFQALNATSCSAAITGAAAATITSGSLNCTGAGCSGLVSAVASFTNTSTTNAATDTVTLTCTGASGQATSVATVTVPKQGPVQTGGSCPTVVKGDGTAGVTSFGQQGSAQLRVGGDQHTITADMTSYSSVFSTTFPGTGTIVYDILPINNYISMQVQAPAGFFSGASADWRSKIGVGTTDDDAKASVTISRTCGDFSNPATDPGSSVVPGCYKVGVIAEGGVVFSSPLGSVQCKLADLPTGQYYYFNLINANITNVTSTGGTASSYRDGPGSTCTGQSTCSVPIENGPVSSYP